MAMMCSSSPYMIGCVYAIRRTYISYKLRGVTKIYDAVADFVFGVNIFWWIQIAVDDGAKRDDGNQIYTNNKKNKKNVNVERAISSHRFSILYLRWIVSIYIYYIYSIFIFFHLPSSI